MRCRVTAAEFGRAQAKGVSVLRVGWPDATPSSRTATGSRVELLAEESDAASGRLCPQHVFGPDKQLLSKAATVAGMLRINIENNWRKLLKIKNVCESEGFRFVK